MAPAPGDPLAVPIFPPREGVLRANAYDAICLLCGFQTGHLVGAQYQPSKECAPGAAVIDVRRLRCCRCGGSVYLEAAEQPSASSLLLDVPHRVSA
jgi:hypothetical protein